MDWWMDRCLCVYALIHPCWNWRNYHIYLSFELWVMSIYKNTWNTRMKTLDWTISTLIIITIKIMMIRSGIVIIIYWPYDHLQCIITIIMMKYKDHHFQHYHHHHHVMMMMMVMTVRMLMMIVMMTIITIITIIIIIIILLSLSLSFSLSSLSSLEQVTYRI